MMSDFSGLLEMLGGSTDLLQKLVCLFLDVYPEQLSTIKDAGLLGDAEKLERAAHGLKGSAAAIRAEEIYEAAHTLEVMGRSGSLEGWQEAVGRLEECLDAFEKASAEYFDLA